MRRPLTAHERTVLDALRLERYLTVQELGQLTGIACVSAIVHRLERHRLIVRLPRACRATGPTGHQRIRWAVPEHLEEALETLAGIPGCPPSGTFEEADLAGLRAGMQP